MVQTSLELPEGVSSVPACLPEAEPHAMDPEAVDLWVEETDRTYLVNFMRVHDLAPLDVLAAAIRATCLRGFGTWMEPQAAPKQRPATHLYEIALFGVTGCGFSLSEAASSWRIAARRITDPVLSA
jgi:hypothetical protein